jgi:diaminopimelate epimerase
VTTRRTDGSSVSRRPGGALRLIKAHAYGNDFLLWLGAEDASADHAPLARRLCDRHRGLGADGVMLVAETREGARTRLLNADGSGSEVSGNGVRCAAAWLAWQRHSRPGATLSIDTEAGAKTLTLLERQGLRFRFRASMGPPADLQQKYLHVGEKDVEVVVLRVGNPQCVVLGPVTTERLQTLAAALAVHPFFPKGTNVELAEVEAADRVRILIWERGVGPTDASGTGACAAAVAAAAFGGAGRDLEIVAPGGTQHVEWRPDGLFLTGWAELVGTAEFWLDAGSSSGGSTEGNASHQ